MDSGSERNPELSEVIRRHLAGWEAQVHTAIAAVVTKWEAGPQRVSCKVLVKDAYLDEEGNRQVESIAVIPGVALMFPGAGPCRITFPISDGNLVINGKTIPATTGTLLHAERSLDRWLSGTGAEVDPEIDHQFALIDGIFIPGLNPFGAPLANVPLDHITVGFDDGVQIHIRPNKITIGEGEDSPKKLVLDGDSVDCGYYIFSPGPPAAFAYVPPPSPFPLPPGAVPLSGLISSSATQAYGK